MSNAANQADKSTFTIREERSGAFTVTEVSPTGRNSFVGYSAKLDTARGLVPQGHRVFLRLLKNDLKMIEG